MKRNTSSILGNMVYDGIEFNSAEKIVKGFASYFSSVFVEDECDNLTSCDMVCDNIRVLHQFTITECDILAAVRKFKNNLTMGHDEVPSFVMKDCVNVFSIPLCHIFNLIVKYKAFSNQW